MNGGSEKRPEPSDTIEAKAAAWLAERDDGMSADAAEAFERWCASDPRHAAAVARLERTWEVLQQLRGFRPEARMHPDCDLLVRRPPAKFAAHGRFALAAALAIMAGLGVSRWVAQQGSTYSTAAAGYQHVLLSDGSVMELRAETEVDVRYGAAERRIRLDRGEAHFTVAKDASRPFFVTVGEVTVRAVGTAFNVVRSEANVEVLVTEGRVRIESTKVASRPLTHDVPSVRAGERAVLATSWIASREARRVDPPIVVEKLAPAAIREALAWQGPRLVFYETPLADVVAEFNRHNKVQLVLRDSELGGIPVGGSFRAENLEAFVRLLAAGNGIEAHRSGHRIELRRAPEDPRGH